MTVAYYMLKVLICMNLRFFKCKVEVSIKIELQITNIKEILSDK